MKALALGLAMSLGLWGARAFGSDLDQDPALVGWWELDDGSGQIAADSSGHGRNGALIGNPAWVSGLIGGALRFNGANWVDTHVTDLLHTWTLACWVMSPSAPGNAKPNAPVSKGNNLMIGWNHTGSAFRGAAAVNVNGVWYGASLMPLAADRWIHLAATYDGETLCAYRDGVLISANAAPSGPPVQDPRGLRIAAHAAAPDCMAGTIDDVRLYSRALGAREIAELVGPPQENEFAEIPINQGADDGEQTMPRPSWNLSAPGLEFSSSKIVALRFENLPLRKGGVLADAYMEFVLGDAPRTSGDLNLVIEGLLVADAPALSSITGVIAEASKVTSAKIKWTVPAAAAAGAVIRSPKISAILDEIAGVPGWESDNAATMILRPDSDLPFSGTRTVRSFESGAAQAPVLCIRHDWLVAQWSMDEVNEGTTPDAMGASHGRVAGASLLSGRAGRCLWFDGINDFVDCGAENDLASPELTIRAWVRPESSSTLLPILHKGGWLLDEDFGLHLSAGQVLFEFGTDTRPVASFFSLNSNTVLPPAEWSCVTATRSVAAKGNASHVVIYVNGVKDRSAVYNFVPVVRRSALFIGEPPFEGAIDDVRIYRASLSAADVGRIYEEVASPPYRR